MENIVEKVIRMLGGQDAVAHARGIRQPSVSRWVKRGKIPPEQIIPLYELLGGRMTLTEMNPILYPKHIFEK